MVMIHEFGHYLSYVALLNYYDLNTTFLDLIIEEQKQELIKQEV
mgnify:CR=1 FL=1